LSERTNIERSEANPMNPLPDALLDTVLDRLAPLLTAAASPDSAREAIREMLVGYHPENANELALAAEVISLQLHMLQALGSAANPELPLNKIVSYRSNAVNLSREQHKAHRKLDQLQRARRLGVPPKQAKTPQPSPTVENAISDVEAIGPAPQPAPKPKAKPPSPESFQKLEAARRITEILQRKQAEYASRLAANSSGAKDAGLPA
jgi:hypothetical protein